MSLVTFAVSLVLTAAQQASAVGTTAIVAVNGDTLPGSTDTFYGFGNSLLSAQPNSVSSVPLNDSGQVAFIASINAPLNGLGIYRGNGTTVTQIVRDGMPAPDGNGTFGVTPEPSLLNTLISDSSHVLFQAFLTGTANVPLDNSGLFRADGTALIQVAREGQLAPDGVSSYGSFPDTVSDYTAMNDNGQVAFFADMVGDAGLFLSDGITTTEIVRDGQAATDGNGIFHQLSANTVPTEPSINNAGHVAFIAALTNTGGGSTDNTGIYLAEGALLTQVIRKGQPAPDGNGVISGFGEPIINEAGQILFSTSFKDTSGGSTDNSGIYRSDGNTLTRIFREGDNAPDGNGVLSGQLSRPTLNDAGQSAFTAKLSGTTGGSDDDSGIFIGDGSSLLQIAREGQTVPDGSGNFERFGTPSINSEGQVFFPAQFSGTQSGLFFYDEALGLQQIAREGDPFLGSHLDQLFTSLATPAGGIIQSGLNNLGQVAYQFYLVDGRRGIAIWTPPLPGDLDGDGFVGIGDLTLVLSNWNQSVPPADPSADPSGDGFIGIDDLNLVLVNWNTGTPPTTNMNIPQPATISIALPGVIALLRSGRG